MKYRKFDIPKLTWRLMLGVISGIIMTVFGVMVLAYLVMSGNIDEEGEAYGVTVVLILASMISSAVSMIGAKEKKLLSCVVTGGIFYILLLGINMLLYSQGVQGGLVTGMLIIGISAATGIIANAPKKSSRMKQIKF